MRFALLATLTLALSAFLAPTAQSEAGAPFMDDPTGDTQFDATFGAGLGVPLANPMFDNADLLSLQVLEDFDAFTFVVGVAAVETTSSADYQIRWVYKDLEYTLGVWHQVIPNVENSWGSYVQSYSEDEGWNYISNIDPVVDAEANTFAVSLPKAYILDGRNRMPSAGDKLADLYVDAGAHAGIFQIGQGVNDRMPDTGEETFVVSVGDLAEGSLRLTSEDRVRVSNGGSTTFVFRALLQNKADYDENVELTLADMPEGWNGTLQSPIKIPAGSERTITALVSVPFEHIHGGFSSFNLSAVSKRDPGSRAAVRMGVLHTPIPQPAGHHAELYLHASNLNSGLFADTLPYNEGTINTDADHTNDAADAAPDRMRGDSTIWSLELDPMLRMGLDFDLEGVGELVGTVVPRGTGEGAMSAKVILYQNDDTGNSDESETLVLAESDESSFTGDLNGAFPFKLTLTPTEDADYIAYKRGQSLALIVEMSGVQAFWITNQQAPSLKTADFKLTLPLNEYHDKLTGIADAEEALELKAEGLVEKAGRPGATMTYPFTLRNSEDKETVVNLDVAGSNAELGTLVPAEQITLGPMESRKLTLAVAIPPESAANQEFEVLIFAHARDDPTNVAIARTKTIAVIGELAAEKATADESEILAAAQAQEEKDTPMGGALLVLAAIGIALVASRKRR